MNNKFFSRDELASLLFTKREGLVVGYTSGVFDILHAGHVDYLQKAKQHCDVLIVGLNSDSSVRSNKGELRPICHQEHRVAVLTALECVSYVFVFDEKNNNLNIETLKPDRYIKAGDYAPATLSSAPIVEAYGGQVVIIPLVHSTSTTGIISTITNRYSPLAPEPISCSQPQTTKKPAAFFDRDGTINHHIEYLSDPAKFEFLPGALEGMKRFQDAGYYLIIVTNQPGIGFGYFTEEDFFRVNKAMLKGFNEAGIGIDKIYFCPDTQAADSNFRKPQTGMFERAFSELPIDKSKSVMIGDMPSDIQAGINAGLKTVQIRGDTEVKPENTQADFMAKNLCEAADFVFRTSTP
jgi:rfaE bifunctional protein nucleotidyltransferase chain/domain